jgi:integrase
VLSVASREWEWIEINPCGKVPKLREPRGRVRFLSDDERARFLEACRQSSAPYLHILVVLALSTGARYMELLGLRWLQIDIRRGTIRLEKTKNGERRSLPLKGLALELMQDHARVRRLDTDLVFPSARDSTRPVHIRSVFEAALARTGIEDFHFHDLRHSCASYLAMNGASLAEISEILGHKTLQMVKRYAHLSDGHVAGIVARMNDAIFGGQS